MIVSFISFLPLFLSFFLPFFPSSPLLFSILPPFLPSLLPPLWSPPTGPAVRYSSFVPAQATPPPLIGQHTVQVLRDTLSYPDDVIKALLDSGAAAQNDFS